MHDADAGRVRQEKPVVEDFDCHHDGIGKCVWFDGMLGIKERSKIFCEGV